MKVYEAVANACRAQGADVAFGLVGDGNVKFVHHWSKACGGRYVAARHEAGAVSMAAGYSRATGRVGLATVTQGPGLTNALTALTAAGKGRIPLVLYTGLPPTTLPGHPQAVDQEALLRIAGAAHQPVGADSVAADVAAAFARAVRERRPVGICIPTDIQDGEGAPVEVGPWRVGNGEVDAAQPLHDDAGATHTHERPVPDTAVLAAAVERIAAAHRPLVVAGRGVLGSPGARAALVQLADRIGALLATTLPIRGFFAGAAWDLGVLGGFAPDLTRQEVGQADCVLAFGASLNYRSTQSGALLHPDAVVIQCDVLADPPGASVDVGLRLVGDAAATADALTRELAAAGVGGRGARTGDLERRLRSHQVHEPFEDAGSPAGVDPRSVMRRLDTLLPAERTVTVDGGHSSGFPSVYLRVPDHHGYVFSLEFAAIGLGLGNAIGAAVGRPDRLSVLVVGDGALLMSLPDLETAVRADLPLVVVVLNDRAYGSELAILSASGLPPDVGLFDNPDLATVAHSLGADGITVRALDDLDRVAAHLPGLDRPLLVDCRITPEVRGPWMRGAFNRSLPGRTAVPR